MLISIFMRIFYVKIFFLCCAVNFIFSMLGKLTHFFLIRYVCVCG